MLQEIGLGKGEARTYTALLELGESQTGALCQRSGIKTSHIYTLLDSLEKKGLVNHKLVNNVKVFRPNHPESLNVLVNKKQEELDRKRKQVQASIQKLKAVVDKQQGSSDYKYFEGISGIKSMWLEINELLKPNSDAAIMASPATAWEKLNVFYLEHHKVRVKKKVFERMILPKGSEKFGKQREAMGKFEARYLPIDNQAEFGVFDGFMFIQYTGESIPRGFLVKDEVFASSFMNMFNVLWEVAN
jgi:sugar-specific transcriptional regulator TrmB